MTETPRLVDWLADLKALNRLFLDYLAMLARDGRPCLRLPRHVARRLGDATPRRLDRIAELPVALFRLDLGAGGVEHALPRERHELARWSLAVTILSSAWHLARSHPFEARTFLHLSKDELRQLRSIPVADLCIVARSPALLGCAFTDAAATWAALVRLEAVEDDRMLRLITLQPAVPGAGRATVVGAARLSI
jgi:hypothetical protein